MHERWFKLLKEIADNHRRPKTEAANDRGDRLFIEIARSQCARRISNAGVQHDGAEGKARCEP
jgi:hypothetical protein